MSSQNPLASLDPRQAFAALKKLCGGAPTISRELGVSLGWIYRWGTGGRDGPITPIPEQHWPHLVKLTRGVVREKDLKALHKRVERLAA